MNKQDINKVKKHLGIKKQDSILLATYLKYGVEFEEREDAVEFVLKKIEDLKKEKDYELGLG